MDEDEKMARKTLDEMRARYGACSSWEELPPATRQWLIDWARYWRLTGQLPTQL